MNYSRASIASIALGLAALGSALAQESMSAELEGEGLLFEEFLDESLELEANGREEAAAPEEDVVLVPLPPDFARVDAYEKIFQRYLLFFTVEELRRSQEEMSAVLSNAQYALYDIKLASLGRPPTEEEYNQIWMDAEYAVTQMGLMIGHYEDWARKRRASENLQLSDIPPVALRVDESLKAWARLPEDLEISSIRDFSLWLYLNRPELLNDFTSQILKFQGFFSEFFEGDFSQWKIYSSDAPFSYSSMRRFLSLAGELKEYFAKDDSEFETEAFLKEFLDQSDGEHPRDLDLFQISTVMQFMLESPSVLSRQKRPLFYLRFLAIQRRDQDQNELFLGRSPLAILQTRAAQQGLLERPEELDVLAYQDKVFSDDRLRSVVEYNPFLIWSASSLHRGDPLTRLLPSGEKKDIKKNEATGEPRAQVWNQQISRLDQMKYLILADLVAHKAIPLEREPAPLRENLMNYRLEDLLRLHYIRTRIKDFPVFKPEIIDSDSEEVVTRTGTELWPSPDLKEIADSTFAFFFALEESFRISPNFSVSNVQELVEWSQVILPLISSIEEIAPGMPLDLLGLGRDHFDSELFFQPEKKLRLYEIAQRKRIGDPRFEAFSRASYTFRSFEALQADLVELRSRLAREWRARATRVQEVFGEKVLGLLDEEIEVQNKRLQSIGLADFEAGKLDSGASAEFQASLRQYHDYSEAGLGRLEEERDNMRLGSWVMELDFPSLISMEYLLSRFSATETFLFRDQDPLSLYEWILFWPQLSQEQKLFHQYELEYTAQVLALEEAFTENLMNRDLETLLEEKGEYEEATAVFLIDRSEKLSRARLLQSLREYSDLASYFGSETYEEEFRYSIPTGILWTDRMRNELQASFRNAGAEMDEAHWNRLMAEAAEFQVWLDRPNHWASLPDGEFRRYQENLYAELIAGDLSRLWSLVNELPTHSLYELYPKLSTREGREAMAQSLARAHLDRKVDYLQLMTSVLSLFWTRIEEAYRPLQNYDAELSRRIDLFSRELRDAAKKLESEEADLSDLWSLAGYLAGGLEGSTSILKISGLVPPEDLVERIALMGENEGLWDEFGWNQGARPRGLFDFEKNPMRILDALVESEAIDQLYQELQDQTPDQRMSAFMGRILTRELDYEVTSAERRNAWSKQRNNSEYFLISDIPQVSRRARELSDREKSHGKRPEDELLPSEQAAVGRSIQEVWYRFSLALVQPTLSYDQFWALFFSPNGNRVEVEKLREYFTDPIRSEFKLSDDSAEAYGSLLPLMIGLYSLGSQEEEQLHKALNQSSMKSLRMSYAVMAKSFFERGKKILEKAKNPHSDELGISEISRIIELALEEPGYFQLLLPRRSGDPRKDRLEELKVSKEDLDQILQRARIQAPGRGFWGGRDSLRAQLREIREFLDISTVLMRGPRSSEGSSMAHLLALLITPDFIEELLASGNIPGSKEEEELSLGQIYDKRFSALEELLKGRPLVAIRSRLQDLPLVDRDVFWSSLERAMKKLIEISDRSLEQERRRREAAARNLNSPGPLQGVSMAHISPPFRSELQKTEEYRNFVRQWQRLEFSSSEQRVDLPKQMIRLEEAKTLAVSKDADTLEVHRRDYLFRLAFPGLDFEEEALLLISGQDLHQFGEREAVEKKIGQLYDWLLVMEPRLRALLPLRSVFQSIVAELHLSGEMSVDAFVSPLRRMLNSQITRSQFQFFLEQDKTRFWNNLGPQLLSLSLEMERDFIAEGIILFGLDEEQNATYRFAEGQKEVFWAALSEHRKKSDLAELENLQRALPEPYHELLRISEWAQFLAATAPLADLEWKITTDENGREGMESARLKAVAESEEIGDPWSSLSIDRWTRDQNEQGAWKDWILQKFQERDQTWFYSLDHSFEYPTLKEGLDKAHLHFWRTLTQSPDKFLSGGRDRLGRDEILREVFGSSYLFIQKEDSLQQLSQSLEYLSEELQQALRLQEISPTAPALEAEALPAEFFERLAQNILAVNRIERAERENSKEEASQSEKVAKETSDSDSSAEGRNSFALRESPDSIESFLLNPGNMETLFLELSLTQEILRLYERGLGKDLAWPERAINKASPLGKDLLFRFVAFLGGQRETYGEESVLGVDWAELPQESLTHLIRIWFYEDADKFKEKSLPYALVNEGGLPWLPVEIAEPLKADFAYLLTPTLPSDAELSAEHAAGNSLAETQEVSLEVSSPDPSLSYAAFREELIFIQNVFEKSKSVASKEDFQRLFHSFRNSFLTSRSVLTTHQAMLERLKSNSFLEDRALELWLTFKRFHRLQYEYQLSAAHLRSGLQRMGEISLGLAMGDYSEFFEALKLKDRAWWKRPGYWIKDGVVGAVQFIGDAAYAMTVGLVYFGIEQIAVISTYYGGSEEEFSDLMESVGAYEVYGNEVVSAELNWFDPRRYSLYRMENIESKYLWRPISQIALNVIGARFVTGGLTRASVGTKWFRKDPTFRGFVKGNTIGRLPGRKADFYELRAFAGKTPRASLKKSAESVKAHTALPMGRGARTPWETFESVMTRPFWLFPQGENVLFGSQGLALREAARVILPNSTRAHSTVANRILQGTKAVGVPAAVITTHSAALTLLMGVPQMFQEGGFKSYMKDFPQHFGTTTALIATLMLTHGKFTKWSQKNQAFAYLNYGMSKGLMYYIMKELMTSGGEYLDFWLEDNGVPNQFLFDFFIPFVEEALNVEMDLERGDQEILYRGLSVEELGENPEAYAQYQRHQEVRMNFWSHVILMGWLVSSPRFGDMSNHFRKAEKQRLLDGFQTLFPRTPEGNYQQMVELWRSHAMTSAEGAIRTGTPVAESLRLVTSQSRLLTERVFAEGSFESALARMMKSSQGRGPTKSEREFILSEAKRAADQGISEARAILLSARRHADIRGENARPYSVMETMTEFIHLAKEKNPLVQDLAKLREQSGKGQELVKREEALVSRLNELRDLMKQYEIYDRLFVTLEGRAWLQSVRDTLLERADGRNTELRFSREKDGKTESIDHLSLTPNAQVFEALFFHSLKEPITIQSLSKQSGLSEVFIEPVQASAIVRAKPPYREGRRLVEEHEVWTKTETLSERMGTWFPQDRRWRDERGFELRLPEKSTIDFGARGEIHIRVEGQKPREIELLPETVNYRVGDRPAVELGWREADLAPVLRSMDIRTGPALWQRLRNLRSGERLHRKSPLDEALRPDEIMQVQVLNHKELKSLMKGDLVLPEVVGANFTTHYRATFDYMGQKVSGLIRVEVRSGTVRTIFPDGSEIVRVPLLKEAAPLPNAERVKIADLSRLLEAQHYEIQLGSNNSRLSASQQTELALRELRRNPEMNQELQQSIRSLREILPTEYAILRFPGFSGRSPAEWNSRSLLPNGEYRVADSHFIELRIGGPNGNRASAYLRNSPFLLENFSVRELARLTEVAAREHALPTEVLMREVSNLWSREIYRAQTESPMTFNKPVSQMTQSDVLLHLETLKISRQQWELMSLAQRQAEIQRAAQKEIQFWDSNPSSLSPIFQWQIRRAQFNLEGWLRQRSQAGGL